MNLTNLTLPKLLPLTRISPSAYAYMQSCTLREVLSNNRNLPQLLPNPPEARLGNVIHKVLELTAKGQIHFEDSLYKCWDTVIDQTEKLMSQNPLERHLVPLAINTRKFEVKRQQCFIIVMNMIHLLNNKKSRKYLHPPKTELWVETPDKKIGGLIDAVCYTSNGVQILDYKTGAILEESITGTAIKHAYQVQLKLYAALYYFSFGEWPIALIIKDLSQKEYDISFTPEECLELLNQAKIKIEAVNVKIYNENDWERLATPSPDSCRFCRFRPVCGSYWEKKDNNNEWPADVKGTISSIENLKNGLRIILKDGNASYTIRGLSLSRHSSSIKSKGQSLMICNLRRDTSEMHYLEGHLTTCIPISEI